VSKLKIKGFPEEPLTGYAEGYYGRLLSWDERIEIVQTLHAQQMNAWLYAPKEDPCHRLNWREPWGNEWISSFGRFCLESQKKGVHVIAGIAPGLDFNFSALSFTDEVSASGDYLILLDKARQLIAAGANSIGLLMDDIDPDFEQRSGDFSSEGHAHATLANKLGNDLGASLMVVPRIYANELVVEDENYLPDFARTLNAQHIISHCGENVVSRTIATSDCEAHLGGHGHRVVVWDNLYANDYCPRRLFVGEWSGREGLNDVLLNPTGMPNTDRLLLELMGVELRALANRMEKGGEYASASSAEALPKTISALELKLENSEQWQTIMKRHGVPAEFNQVAAYCWHPFCNGDEWNPVSPAEIDVSSIEASLDQLLWRWKTP